MSSNHGWGGGGTRVVNFSVLNLSNSLTMGRLYVNLRVIAMHHVFIVLLSIISIIKLILITISIINKLETAIKHAHIL